MSVGHKPLPDLLDEMALKILMIEPGDLSIVGELLDLIEKLLPGQAAADVPLVIQRMAAAFKAVGWEAFSPAGRDRASRDTHA